MTINVPQILERYEREDYPDRCHTLKAFIDAIAPAKIEYGEVLNARGYFPIINPPLPTEQIDAVSTMLAKLAPEKYMHADGGHVRDIARKMHAKTLKAAKLWDMPENDCGDRLVALLAYAQDLINASSQTFGITPPRLLCSDFYVPIGNMSYSDERHTITTRNPAAFKSFEEFVSSLMHEMTHAFQYKRGIKTDADMYEAAASERTRMVALSYLAKQLNRIPEFVDAAAGEDAAFDRYYNNPNEIHSRSYGEALGKILTARNTAAGRISADTQHTKIR